MSVALRGLHSQLRPYAEYALEVAQAYGLEPVVTSVYRSWENQARLRKNYERCLATGQFGRTPECRYPANRPGDSAHNYGLAWDSWVPDAQMPLWRTIRAWVGWRVPEHDQIHAELPEWRQYV